MKKSYAMNRVGQVVAVASCAIAAAGAAVAGAAGEPPGDARPHDARPNGCGDERRPGPPDMPGAMGFGVDRPPPYLMGITLTEEQQDKIFSIMHAAAPEFREHMKAARKARDALRDLGQSTAFDNGRAAALAQAQASAESQLSLLRTRTDHDIFQLLTPEQRSRIAERQREHDAHAHGEAP
jgi:protein CpxP